MATETIKVPDLGDSSEVEVIELLVKVGQSVAENDSLLVLESDKAAMEIPAPTSGVVKSIAVNLGDQVSTGSEILTLEVEGESSSPKAEEPAEKAPEQVTEKPAREDEGAGKAQDTAPGTSTREPELRTIEVPDLGGESDVEVIEIHVSEGDTVKVDDSLITLESDKAAMDVPSTLAGEVKTLKLKVGDKVSKGSAILELLAQPEEEPESAKQDAKPAQSVADSKPDEKPASAPTASSPVTDTRQDQNVSAGGADVYAGPAVRKLARELGVDLSQVNGSGAKGRIIKEDIHEFVKSRLSQGPTASGTGFALPAVPDIDFSQFGEVEQVSMSKLHRVTAVNMQRNWSTVPHVAQFNEADVTDLEEFRQAQKAEADRRDAKLTFLPFLLKACVKTLQEYPQFNISLHSSGEYYIQKKYYHIGVAVATEAGLVVPVIRNVDRKSLWELAAELAEVSDKARQRRLSKEDMQGACFTISSLGAIGGTGFIPIINAPEVAILGVGKTETKPVFQNGEFVPRSMLPLTLSYDHRAVNGVDGGLFSTYLVKVLGDIRLLLL
ncbi:MAG: dihydrolipoyllysine-residue acetyltransferase [Gammaproteobacteria bacterium]|nr:dihydrolipoyllysine-residue acetyltransferase [Pseudomonadales bacterium]MCP5345593.1 dihydrolipoyllysine-residue acetyltransferase [Pseudomonadales bacterium]